MKDELLGLSHVEEKLLEVHNRLAQAVEKLTTGDEWRRAIEFAARFRSRSFNNTLLIWAQHSAAYEKGTVLAPTPTFVAGFRQWQQLGHQVLKGQRGYAILAPVTASFAAVEPDDSTSWRRLPRGEKPHPGETLQSRMIGVKPAYVWDISQTSGPPVPQQQLPTLLRGEAPAGLWQGLARLVEDEGFALSHVADAAAIGRANGRTDFVARTVCVRGDMDAAAQVKTLSHELAHIRLHGSDNPDATLHRGIGEVEAESVALMIGAAQGLDTSAYTIPYVSTWATSVNGKTPVEVVQATAERVRSTAVAILSRLDTPQVGSGDPPGLARVPHTRQPTLGGGDEMGRQDGPRLSRTDRRSASRPTATGRVL